MICFALLGFSKGKQSKAKQSKADADCGGACACATCHIYVREDWLEKTGAREEMEEDMLDFAYDVRDNSRLSCQIKISDALDGLTVDVPEKQF